MRHCAPTEEHNESPNTEKVQAVKGTLHSLHHIFYYLSEALAQLWTLALWRTATVCRFTE